jgi:hypothetical protein
MDNWSNDRLTVVGPEEDLARFLKSQWYRRLGARHGEMMENFRRRHVGVFETDEPPIEPLRKLSRRWPTLIFMLDYEVQVEPIKGLAKLSRGNLTHCQLNY